jgi:hypothetical protein
MKPIEYDIYPKPRPMHVIVAEGVKKFSFANVKDWEDLNFTGPTYPFNANIDIVAEARVPIGDETATYFMDALALGTDFDETHMPAYTVGFNHSQLADGFVEPQKKPIPPERQQRLQVLIQSDKDQPSPTLASLPTTELDFQTVEDAVEWRKWLSTYVAFEDGPKLFVADQEMWVKDFMGKRADKLLKANMDVVIGGTFIKEDVVYGRPLAAAKNFLWYGIPMTNLIPEEELYNTDIPLHERVALPHGRLSLSERYVVVPLAKVVSQTTRLKTFLDKTKTTNNKKENP